MEERAQGAIEYLLIIGAAILVVAIVVLAVSGALTGAKTTSRSTQSDVNLSLCKTDCNALGGNTCKLLFTTGLSNC